MSSLKKAVILAAGKGTRMGALTAELPKPMLPVRGVPVLERIVRNLVGAGASEVLIITGYKAEVVESHFGDGTGFGCRIEFTRQVTQDGTGKVVELSRPFVGEDPFFLAYGDILTEPETYLELAESFRSDPSIAGLVTVKLGEDVTQGGLLIFDSDRRLLDLVEKPSAEKMAELRRDPDFKPWYNAGLYAFGPELFGHLETLKKSPRGEYELTDAIVSLAKDTRRVYAREIRGYWIDVRDPALLARAQELVR